MFRYTLLYIFNDRFPAEQEYILRSVKPLPHSKRQATKSSFDPAWASYNDKLPKSLPPLAEKPQVIVPMSLKVQIVDSCTSV